MQIIIPMSGFGDRFRLAGYKIPKPLIMVDEKPIIQHIVEMFPGEKDFTFICNSDHLDQEEYRMRKILESVCPTGKIVPIKPHKLGPIHAVMQALDYIDPSKPVIVNYSDFSCFWDYDKFKETLIQADWDGAIPSYRGFHPHTLWSNYYAYVREKNLIAYDIQEKQPFTDNPVEEFASSGTYYFKSGALMQKYFQICLNKKMMVNNEYYVSMAYKPMMEDGCRVYVYEVPYFMQWGTPDDLEEYCYWSKIFKDMLNEKKSPQHEGVLLMPMAGLGSRFQKKGYSTPKPLIPVSGRPMAVQSMNDLPKAESQHFILRKNTQGVGLLKKALSDASKAPQFTVLDYMTDGQASTCVEGANKLDPEQLVTIGACDSGMLYDPELFEKFLSEKAVDIIVWGARGHPGAIRSPEMYGWIEADTKTGNISSVSVKVPLENPKRDPIIVGAFTFRHLRDFFDAVKRMKERKATVNGEYYVDMAINDAIALGLNCKLFEIDSYICWGTPNELKTFEYWQSCFHKWPSHPYRLEKDQNVDKCLNVS
jgi:NDP-sugar pyrophosphorylase family protein